jgi:uncharacterized repeat protein (TIGR03803 family)
LGSPARASNQGYTYEQLFVFSGDTNGYGPEGALVQAADGNFYGTCAEGGQPTSNCPTCGYGTVFKMTPSGYLTTIAWFGYTNGAYPYGAMIEATDGNFYGTAGWLFRLTPGGDLTGAAGGELAGDPIQGTNSYIYSADAYYGYVRWSSLDGSGAGSVYAPGTLSSGLIQASDGNFYGLTSSGGTAGFGTAYKLTPGGVLTTLVSFGGTNIGRWPYGKMLQASDGNLYGICASPDQVFKLTLSGTLTTFAVFGTNGDRGTDPNGGLIEANDGNFYGTTYSGGGVAGAGGGTVFKITPQARLSTLFAFTTVGAYPGSSPLAGLVQGSDGNLYGTCAYGGAYGGGNIFRIIMPGPQLNIGHTANQLVLSWRTNYVGFTLQSSHGLSPPNWADCTNSPTVSGGQFWTTNPISSGAQFFRLRK